MHLRIVVAGLSLAISSSAWGQYNSPRLNAVPFGPLPPFWTGGFDLGTPPSVPGGYTRYLVVTDWTNVGGGSQSSAGLRFALHGGPLSSNPGMDSAGPAQSGPIHTFNPNPANGATALQSQVSNLWWQGNISVAAPIAGGQPVRLSFQCNQPGSNGRVSNTVVTLNPRIDDQRTFRGQVVPTPDLVPQTFTDLGTLRVGDVNLSLPVSAALGSQGTRWYRFQVDRTLSAGEASTFDLFTTAGNTSLLDSQLIMFRETGAGLIPAASSDQIDLSFSRAAGLSFGSASPTLFGRGYGLPGAAGYFAGQGGNETLLATAAPREGFFANQAGGASLSAGQTYWLAVGHGSLTLSGTLATQSLGADRRSIVWSDEVVYGLSGPTSFLETSLEIRSVPGPGGFAIGLLGLWSARRRRG